MYYPYYKFFLSLCLTKRLLYIYEKWKTVKVYHYGLQERLTWCLNAVDKKEDFRNVIFTDENTVEMCSTGRLFFHQKSPDIQQKTSRRSRPKHAYKVNKCIFKTILSYMNYANWNYVYIFPVSYTHLTLPTICSV